MADKIESIRKKYLGKNRGEVSSDPVNFDTDAKFQSIREKYLGKNCGEVSSDPVNFDTDAKFQSIREKYMPSDGGVSPYTAQILNHRTDWSSAVSPEYAAGRDLAQDYDRLYGLASISTLNGGAARNINDSLTRVGYNPTAAFGVTNPIVNDENVRAAAMKQYEAEEQRRGLAPLPVEGNTADDVINAYQGLRDREDEAKYNQYMSLIESDDFDQLSEYRTTKKQNEGSGTGSDVRYTSTLYEQINNNEELPELQKGFNNLREMRFQLLSEDEKRVFNYLYNKEGYDSAKAFLDSFDTKLNARMRKQAEEHFAAQAAAEGDAAALGRNIMESPLKSLSAVANVVNLVKDGRIDQNAWYNSPVYRSVARSQEATKDMSPVGQFLYGTAESIGSFLLNTFVSQGLGGAMGLTEKGVERLALSLMSSQAASQTLVTAKDSGYSDGQAVMLSALAGFAEYITERYSIEALLNVDSLHSGKWSYIAKNVLAEGSEEFGSDMINWLGEILILGDKSQWRKKINDYVKLGCSENDAFAYAIVDQAMQSGLSALGGALSGFALSAGNVALNDINLAALGYQFKQENDNDALMDLARKGMENDSSSAAFKGGAMMEKALEKGKTPSALRVGTQIQYNAAADLEDAQSNVIIAQAVQHLKEDGEITREDAKAIRENLMAQQEIFGSLPEINLTESGINAAIKHYADLNESIYESDKRAASRALVASGAARFEREATTIAPSSANNLHIRNVLDAQTSIENATRIADTVRESKPELANLITVAYEDIAQNELELQSTPGVDFATAMIKAYDLGTQNKSAIKVTEGFSQIAAKYITQAHDAGVRAAEGGINVEETGRPGDDRGNERVPGMVTAEQVEGLRNEIISGAEDDNRSAAKTILRSYVASVAKVKPVSGKSLGIKDASAKATMRLLPKSGWSPRLKKLGEYVNSIGLEFVPFVGPITMEDGSTARGAWTSNGKLYVRVDHDMLTPEQITLHELFHALSDRYGTDAMHEKMRQAIIDKYNGDTARLKKLTDAYAREYAKYNMKPENVFEELLADAFAGIDIFDYIGWNHVSAADVTDVVGRETDKIASGITTRGPPETVAGGVNTSNMENLVLHSTSGDVTTDDLVSTMRDVTEMPENKTALSVDLFRNAAEKQQINIKSDGFDGKPLKGKKSGRQVLEETLKKSGMPVANQEDILSQLDALADWMEASEVRYTAIGLADINHAKLVIDPVTGRIVLTAMVKNGDYPVNFDLTKTCAKRAALSKFIAELAKTKGRKGGKSALDEITLTQSNIFKMNQILRDAGYETACLGCFVETKRYNINDWVTSILDMWNGFVDKYDPNAPYFEFADEKDVYVSSLSTDDIIKLSDELENYKKNTKQALQEKRKRTNKPKALLTSEERLEQLVKSYPTMRKKLRVADLITENGRTALHRDFPELESAIVMHYGSATPKSQEVFTPYNNEIELMSEKVGKKSLKSYLTEIFGVRSQSFGDFIITHLFDVMQKTAGLAARGLKAHTYTKVLERAVIFGQTHEKINLSVMFNIDPAVDDAHAGLKANGDYFLGDQAESDYQKSIGNEPTFVQSIPFKEAVALQNTPGYSADCGTIGVGLSWFHMLKMLDDRDMRWIIAYHRSQMPVEISELTHQDKAADYTSVQNTLNFKGFRKVTNTFYGVPSFASWSPGSKETEAYDGTFDFSKYKSGKEAIRALLKYCADNSLTCETSKYQEGHGGFDIYGDLEKTNDPRKTADNYIDWCISNGKLPLDYEFAFHDNYYKVLFDGNMYDCITEEYAPQLPVEFKFPEGVFKKGADGKWQIGEIITSAFEQANANEEIRSEAFQETFAKITNMLYENSGQKSKLSRDTDIRYSRDTAPTFYSRLEREIEAYKGDKIGAASVISYLNGKGVKDEEIKWTGIATFLEGKKSVSKSELVQYLKDNELKIEEEELGKGVDTNNEAEYFEAKDRLEQMAWDKVEELGLKDVHDIDINEDESTWVAYPVSEYGEVGDQALATLKTDGAKWEHFKTSGGENYREILYKIPGSSYINSSMRQHWKGTTGVVAHARVQDFETGDGKILFVDEIQSDWHNAGAMNGYGKVLTQEQIDAAVNGIYEKFIEQDENVSLLRKVAKQDGWTRDTSLSTTEDKVLAAWTLDMSGDRIMADLLALGKIGKKESDAYDQFKKELKAVKTASKNVPDAPFRNGTYVQYVLKDLLRKAAEGGYDYLAWTTGKMQEERWSDQYAEGYRIEYDQDIPKFLSKYGKQWGAKLGEIDLFSDNPEVGRIEDYIDEFYELSREYDSEMTRENLLEGIGQFTSYDAHDYCEYVGMSPADEERFIELGLKLRDAQAGRHISDVGPLMVPAIPITEAMRDSVLYKGQSRFSRDTDPLAKYTDETQKRIESLQEALKKQTERAEHFKGETHLKLTKDGADRYQVSDKGLRQIVNALQKSYGSDADITEDLRTLINDFLNGRTDRNAAFNAAIYIGNHLIAKSKELVNPEDEQTLRRLKEYLKHQKISINDHAKSDIPDYEAFRRRNLSRIRLTNDGLGMDVVYMELQDTFGKGLFPDGIDTQSEQLLQLDEVLKALQPAFENPFTSRSAAAEAVDAVAVDIINTLLNSDEIDKVAPTFADKQKMRREKEVKGLKEYYTTKIADIRARKEKAIQDLKDNALRARERKRDREMRTRLLKIVKRLQNKKLPAVQRQLLDQYIGDIDTVAKSITGTTIQNLTALRDWYEDQKQNNPDFIADKITEDRIARLSKRRIGDMTQDEVIELTQVLLNIENEIAYQKRLIDEQERRDIYELARVASDDIMATKGTNLKAQKADRYFIMGGLSGERAIRRMTGYVDDDPLYQLTLKLSEGQRDMLDFQRRAYHMVQHFTEDKSFVESLTGKKAKRITIEGTERGKRVKVDITPAERISLYLHSKNDSNLYHIRYGGISIPDFNLLTQGKLEQAYDDSVKRTITLTPSEIRDITSQMDDKELAFANAISAYFNGMSQQEINEVSEKLKGYSLAQVENYFPIETDDNFLSAEYETLQMDGTIEGMGFLKERVQKSSTAINLREAQQVLNQSIRMTSKYVGLAIPVRNMSKVLNVRLVDYYLPNDPEDTMTAEAGKQTEFKEKTQEGTIRKAIGIKWHKAGKGYVQDLMTDLQNPRHDEDTLGSFMNKITSNYAGAVLEMNLGVAIKQTASYPTAMAVLGLKPLVQALGDFGSVDLRLIEKYTPLQWYRSLGYSTTELGDMASGVAKDVPTYLKWIQTMDLVTTRKLWKASEIFVQQENPGIPRGTDEYYKEVAKVYNRVIEETQPNYTVMQRPELLRSKNALTRALNLFKTQPYQNFGLLYDAVQNYKAKQSAFTHLQTPDADKALKKAKKELVNAIVSQLLAALLFAVMQGAWDGMRGKTKAYRDKAGNANILTVGKGLTMNMLSTGFGMVPLGSFGLEFIENAVDKVSKSVGGEAVFDQSFYGAEVPGIETLNGLAEGLGSVLSTIAGTIHDISTGDGVAGWETLRNLYKASAQGFQAAGVPVQNTVNFFNMIAQNAAHAFEWANGNWYLGYYRSLRIQGANNTEMYKNLYQAYLNDMGKYTELYNEMISDGYSEAAIKNFFKKMNN